MKQIFLLAGFLALTNCGPPDVDRQFEEAMREDARSARTAEMRKAAARTLTIQDNIPDEEKAKLLKLRDAVRDATERCIKNLGASACAERQD